MRFHVLTLFPGAFKGPFDDSIIGRATERGLIRDYTHEAHGTADDYQVGGGAGMVLKAEPIFEFIWEMSDNNLPNLGFPVIGGGSL